MTMPQATRYLVALFCVCLAALIHFWLGGILQDRPFPLFYLAVLIVAAVAGFGPTILATFSSGIAAVYWFIEPAGAFKLLGAGDLIKLGSFSIIGLSLAILVEIKDRALERAVVATRELADEKGAANWQTPRSRLARRLRDRCSTLCLPRSLWSTRAARW